MADAPILGGTKKLKLDDAVFGAPFNGPLVHETVIAELAARRRGTHSTRTRGMVRGGGAKPWRQKGTGRARQGTIRAPQWTGGGVVFGPSPRHYTVKVNRKARKAALRSALSLHAERGSLFGLDAGALRRALDQAGRRPARGPARRLRAAAARRRGGRGGQVVPQPRARERAARRGGRGRRHRRRRDARRVPGRRSTR